MTNGLQHPHLILIILIILLIIIIPWLQCLFPFLGNVIHNTSNDVKSYNTIYNAIYAGGTTIAMFQSVGGTYRVISRAAVRIRQECMNWQHTWTHIAMGWHWQVAPPFWYSLSFKDHQ
jgi:hypothetical protein